MTVHELIEALSSFPPDHPVFAEHYEGSTEVVRLVAVDEHGWRALHGDEPRKGGVLIESEGF